MKNDKDAIVAHCVDHQVGGGDPQYRAICDDQFSFYCTLLGEYAYNQQ